jgi:hypothetical protein
MYSALRPFRILFFVAAYLDTTVPQRDADRNGRSFLKVHLKCVENLPSDQLKSSPEKMYICIFQTRVC